MPKKKTDKQKPDLHEDLKDFEIKINEFGEITTNMDVSKLNEFLDENVEDKKLKEQQPKEKSEEE